MTSDHRVSRRTALGLIGAAAAGGAAWASGLAGRVVDSVTGDEDGPFRTADGPGRVRWSDPSTWAGGNVPGPEDHPIIDRAVLLDRDVEIDGLTIGPRGDLAFDPGTSRTLRTTANVVVLGRLAARPDADDVVHTLRFVDVDEAAFVGGGVDVLDTDVGLWVVEGGVLDAAGAAKTAWARATGTLTRGARTLTVTDADGWRVGDAVAIAPSGPPRPLDEVRTKIDVEHCLTYDEATITSIDGTEVGLSRALAHDHPVVRFEDWAGKPRSFGAEVLNLTRNVVVEGTPTGRAHVMFLRGSRPQTLRHLELRHLGPRRIPDESTPVTEDHSGGHGEVHADSDTKPDKATKPDKPGKAGKDEDKGKRPKDPKLEEVTGRYGLHFHHCEDGTKGSVVEGVVAHRLGTHAFVPHQSNGITLRDCVAHDVEGSAYWWDLHERDSEDKPTTDGSRWERCVASKVHAEIGSGSAYRLSGFSLGEGTDKTNSCTDCVAVAVYTTDEALTTSAMTSGFHWPERGKAIWNFSGCVAHNMGGSGILTWQNDEHVHLIEQFVAYHCGKAGIDHGAYANFWQYRQLALYANRFAGLAIHAITRRTDATPAGAPLLRFEDLRVDGGGLTAWGIQSEGHRFPASVQASVVKATVGGCRKASFYEPAINNQTRLQFVDCSFSAKEFWVDDGAAPGTALEVVRLNGSAASFVLRQKEQAGRYVPDWNAVEEDAGADGP